MDDSNGQRDARLEAMTREIQRLAERVGGLEDRVQALEKGTAVVRPALATEADPAALPAAGERADAPPRGEALVAWAGIAGGIFSILAGAYFLRALTERGTLAQSTGVALALTYSVVWLVMAYRGALIRPTLSATAYGLAFVLVAFPMLVEATTRFDSLGLVPSAVAIALVGGVGIVLASTRRLHALSWVILAAALVAAVTCVVHTREAAPFLCAIVFVTAVADGCSARVGWTVLRVGACGAADMALLAFTTISVLRSDWGLGVLVGQLLLFVAFMGPYVARSWLKHRPFAAIERLQAIAVLVLGYLAAVLTAVQAGADMALALGAASLVLGGGAYLIAYMMFVLPAKNGMDAWFNSSYPLVSVLAGTGLLLEAPAYAWAATAVVLGLVGMRDRHAALPLHGAVAALLASLAAGLPGELLAAFTGATPSGAAPLSLPDFAAVGAAVLVISVPNRTPEARELVSAKLARATALLVIVAGGGALAMRLLSGVSAMASGGQTDAAWVPTLGTLVLAASAVGLAALGRTRRLHEAGWFVYPILAVAGVKILIQDLSGGRPATLTLAFAAYGLALFLAPRILRRPVRK